MRARAFMRLVVQRLATLVLVLAVGYLAGFGVSLLARHGQSDQASQTVERPAERPRDSQSDSSATGDSTSRPSPAADASYQPPSASYSAWDEAQSPNYYREIGPAVVGEQPERGTVRYGALDSLGRATGAVAQVTYDLMKEGIDRARGDTSDIHPSGWGYNEEVDIAMPDGTVYHGQLFNRSHLIAKSLGGEERIENLVTGTRTQNVGVNIDGSEGGMAYAEGLAREWLARHKDQTLYYAATPVYEGDELVARSIIVDLRSSDGALDKRIEAYNTARGFEIDYATGTFRVTEDAQEAARAIGGTSADAGDATQSRSPSSDAVEPTGSPDAENGERKVLITRSGKAYHHDETCKGLQNARSLEWVTVSEAESQGRHACGICGG